MPFKPIRLPLRLVASLTASLAGLLLTAFAQAAAVPAGVTPPAPHAGSQQVAPGQVPKGLSASDWHSVQRQIKARRYQVQPAVPPP